jgi:Arc/MetJ-type ribon-helix-helix transcriptional regulator
MAVRKIGISVDESTYKAALKVVETGEFRNLSHVFEQAARFMLKDKIESEQKDPYKALLATTS